MRGFDLYNPEEHHGLAYLYGEDPGVACLSRAANMLWLLGYPDQALVKNQEAIELSQALTHPFSLDMPSTLL